MPRALEIAVRRAVAERCVSVIVIPGDIALKPAPDAPAPKPFGLIPFRPSVTPPIEAIEQLATLLNGAGRVTLLCGSGCEGAHDELLQLAGLLKAPIVHAMRGKEHVEWDNPFDVGLTGLIGFRSGYVAMETCDVLLMLGTDFPYPQFFPTQAKVIQVDIRGRDSRSFHRTPCRMLRQVGGRLAFRGYVALCDPGARANPFIARVDEFFEIGIG